MEMADGLCPFSSLNSRTMDRPGEQSDDHVPDQDAEGTGGESGNESTEVDGERVSSDADVAAETRSDGLKQRRCSGEFRRYIRCPDEDSGGDVEEDATTGREEELDLEICDDSIDNNGNGFTDVMTLIVRKRTSV